jgi:hypothetical protein
MIQAGHQHHGKNENKEEPWRLISCTLVYFHQSWLLEIRYPGAL